MCSACISIWSGFHGGLALVLVLARHIAGGGGGGALVVVGDSSGADTAVRACVAAPAAALVGCRVIQLRVDILRAARHTGGSVHQGERHTAALDQESPPEPSPQIGVLRGGEQGRQRRSQSGLPIYNIMHHRQHHVVIHFFLHHIT